MATVDLTPSSVALPSEPWASPVKRACITVDLAKAVTAKGSALAPADVVKVIDLPANSVVLAAGYDVTTALSGPSTTVCTIKLGDSGDDDRYVAAQSAVVTGAGTLASTNKTTLFTSADALQITLASITDGSSNTTITAGNIRVWVVYTSAA